MLELSKSGGVLCAQWRCVLRIISLISDVEAGKHGAEAVSEPSWIHELGTSS